MRKELKAPFPYFGGKSKVTGLVWERLGGVDNYIEPFCGSAKMLLDRPTESKVETINDSNAFLANFWRAVQSDPAGVAKHADWPVNETDLHARHKWLVFSQESQENREKIRTNPEYYNSKIAGWWAWGACCWIGSGWCPELSEQLPHITGSQGVNKLSEQLPHISPSFSQGAVPEASGTPQSWRNGRGQLADAYSRGRGVNGNDKASFCDDRRAWLTEWMLRLADRLRSVRVCCGHWSRVCDSPSTTVRLGLTGVFLDPPYRKTVNGKENRSGNLYSNDATQDVNALCDEVQGWCIKWQKDLRIILCGYEGEYPELDHWECKPWKAQGGYGNQSGSVNENANRERIWFSPMCVPDKQRSLF